MALHTAASVVLRLALAAPFLVSGLLKLTDFGAARAEVAALGLSPPELFAAAVVVAQLGGSALLLSGRFQRAGAVVLAGFTVAATLLAHPFWAMDATVRVPQAMTFLEHVAIVGGFGLVALGGARVAGTRGIGAPARPHHTGAAT
ncbi:DoxX family protein [Acuticoccus yangtzensis]|uniref:DoxX family protein n=1 Tax=Acuticoccus yangtzensis TaxID=1443441 RepID=UPI000949A320|nr:DoxX family protein [Acuticoccus yangtzensis]